MSTITELREKAQKIYADARVELDKITDETPEAEAKEIEARFDTMMAEADKYEARADREEKLAEGESRLNQPDPRRPKGEDGAVEPGQEGPPEYRDVFEKSFRFGVASLTAEERGVLMENRIDIPEEVRAQAAGTDTAGGHTVPEEFSGEIDREMATWGPMWDPGVARELNTSNGRRIEWPTVDDTANTGRIKAENASVDDDGTDDVVFGNKQLDAFIFDTGMVRVPLELLQDSAFNMETFLNDLFGERLGRLANTELTTGSGTNRPNGIVTASGLGKTAASGTALDADEIIDLFHSVDPAYRASPQARWQFNDSTLAAIRKLKDGQGNYLWQVGDVRTGEPARLLDKPFSVNQAMADIGLSAKPIIFGDHSRYVVRKVMGFQVLTLRERFAEKFQIGLVGFKRFDGELLNDAAVKHMVMAAA